jgi:hypothetical protein
MALSDSERETIRKRLDEALKGGGDLVFRFSHPLRVYVRKVR